MFISAELAAREPLRAELAKLTAEYEAKRGPVQTSAIGTSINLGKRIITATAAVGPKKPSQRKSPTKRLTPSKAKGATRQARNRDVLREEW